MNQAAGAVTSQGGEVARLRLGRWDIANRLKEAAVVEPVHPFEGGKPDALEATPWAATANDLGFEQANDTTGQSIVAPVADATTEDSIPASAKRSVWWIDTYRTPRSLWRTKPVPRRGHRPC